MIKPIGDSGPRHNIPLKNQKSAGVSYPYQANFQAVPPGEKIFESKKNLKSHQAKPIKEDSSITGIAKKII